MKPSHNDYFRVPNHSSALTAAELARLEDEDIAFSDIPETDEAFWASAETVEPAAEDRKERITIRLDADVIDYFRKEAEKRGGAGYQTRINAVLKAYVSAHR